MSSPPTRHRVLALLGHPRCAREVRERIPGAQRKRIETALQRLAMDRLIECVSPDARQSRLYRRTYLGDLLLEELTGRPAGRTDVPDRIEIELRSFVQAGKYRRLVLRVMEGDQTARKIRKAVLPAYKRIGANHVHAVLRAFAARGIAQREGAHSWRLTALGERLRAVELEGLPERPTAPAPLWTKIEPAQDQHDRSEPEKAEQGEFQA